MPAPELKQKFTPQCAYLLTVEISYQIGDFKPLAIFVYPPSNTSIQSAIENVLQRRIQVFNEENRTHEESLAGLRYGDYHLEGDKSGGWTWKLERLPKFQ